MDDTLCNVQRTKSKRKKDKIREKERKKKINGQYINVNERRK
jgi:hypothetical protein